jgi:hypothetical protein
MARAGPSCAICSLSSPIASKLAWRAGQGARVLQCAFQHALLAAAAQRLRQLRQLSQPQMLHGSRSACVLQVCVVRASEKCDNEDAQSEHVEDEARMTNRVVSRISGRAGMPTTRRAQREPRARRALFVCLFVCLFVSSPLHRIAMRIAHARQSSKHRRNTARS